MKVTALVAYSTACGACEVFKRDYEHLMLKAFREKNVNVVTHVSKSLAPLEGATPKILNHINFFPCVILIDSDTLAVADKLSLRFVLSVISVFNGHTSTAPSDGAYFIPKPLEKPYKMTVDGYKSFVDDFVSRRTMERALGLTHPVHSPFNVSLSNGTSDVTSEAVPKGSSVQTEGSRTVVGSDTLSTKGSGTYSPTSLQRTTVTPYQGQNRRAASGSGLKIVNRWGM